MAQATQIKQQSAQLEAQSAQIKQQRTQLEAQSAQIETLQSDLAKKEKDLTSPFASSWFNQETSCSRYSKALKEFSCPQCFQLRFLSRLWKAKS